MVSIMPFGRISSSNCCLHASGDTRTLGNWRVQRSINGEVFVISLWLSLQERAWKSNLKYLSSWPSLSLQLSLAILLRPSLYTRLLFSEDLAKVD